MSDHPEKVAMIGLDAADLDFIQANIDSLPNLRRILESGITRKLGSTAGALTGSVWPTFYTGKTPGDHGIYHHLQWDSSRMQLRRVSEDWLYCEPFWYELEQRELRVVALDVPMTFRPRLSRGVEVITWGSHDELTPFAAHPRAENKTGCWIPTEMSCSATASTWSGASTASGWIPASRWFESCFSPTATSLASARNICPT